MKVRCTAEIARPVFPDAVSPVVNWSCNVTPGRIYLVLGMTLSPEVMFHGRGVTLEILDDDDDWALAPLHLFEVVDPRLSKYWRVKQLGEHGAGIFLAPPSFHDPYWADDLTEGIPAVVADYRAVVAKLRAEFPEEEGGA